MTADLDQLTADAQAADQRAAEIRASVRDRHAAESAERAERDLDWLRRYLDRFDLDALRQEIADARAGVASALHDSELGRALLRLAVAERVGYSERSFAGQAALRAGIDPLRITGNNPLHAPPARDITDPLALLVEVVATEAERLTREHEAERLHALEAHGTDHGRLNVAAPQVQPLLCGACERPVPPDQVSWHNDGVPFHDDPKCKPRPLFPDANLADDEAQRMRLRKLGLL